MMESTEPPTFIDDLKPQAIPTENEKEENETNKRCLEEKEAEIPIEISSSDEEESEKQLTIADLDDDKQIKEDISVQQDDTIKENAPPEEQYHPESYTEDAPVENDTRSSNTPQPQQVIAEEEKEDKTQEDDIKQVELQFPKLNGNHSLSLNDDDDTCSSSTSSASSHNLVIDHPLAEENPPTKQPSVETEDNGAIETISEGKSLKRKLSACENGSPQYKQIHLESERGSSSPHRDVNEIHQEMKAAITELPAEKSREEVVKSPPSLENFWGKSIAPPRSKEIKPSSPSPFEPYVAPGSSLPTPNLNFDCFKCKNVIFHTFTQLRDHHKVCLLKDNHRKSPTATPSKESSLIPPAPTEPPSEPPAPPETQPKKRFYLCSSCGTFHENWNLFLHIREIHNRHVCLYCIRLFPTAEKLSLHLEIKHDLEQNHFNSEEKLRSVSKGDGNSRFLMCCTCQHVFSEHERFSDHICTEYMQPCSLCSQKGRHLNNCKANPEKRPKVKKKPKAITSATVTKSNSQLPRSSATTSVAATPTATPASLSACDNKFNNNNQMVLSTLPLSLQSLPPLLPPVYPPQEFSKQNGFSEPPSLGKCSEEHQYHSDDSTNMVIDETCNNNSYINEMSGVNPFKALDERERLQEEVQKTAETKTALPPDRVPEAIPEPKPLIVPKIKLRVPKEFQKAVESEISSTESDDDEDEDEDVDEGQEEGDGDEENQRNLEVSLENSINTNDPKEDESDDNDACSQDNTQDWDESNSNLDRILKEIEKTKLDIQRTKELLEPMNNLKKVAPHVTSPRLMLSPASRLASSPASRLGLSPASRPASSPASRPSSRPASSPASRPSSRPHLSPASRPNSRLTSRLALSPASRPTSCTALSPASRPMSRPASRPLELLDEPNIIVNEDVKHEMTWATPERGMYSPTPMPTPNSAWTSPSYLSEVSPAALQAVSERENIENMEKESDQAKEQTSESDKMDISTDLDVESVHHQEESTMDVEEKVNSSVVDRHPQQPLDFTPIVLDTESKISPVEPLQPKSEHVEDEEEIEIIKEKPPPADGIEVASDDVQITDLQLDRPIEKFEIIEFVRLCVTAVYSLCLYCNHARRIAVSGHSLVLHLLAQHRFAATVDSITAEELLPSTIVSKLKSFLPDLEEHYFNLKSYCSMPPKETNAIAYDERQFECFQCRFSTKMHKDLYLHNRKMHLKTAILCFMCRANFFSFSEILCHICPGQPNKVTVFDIKFRCCLCDVDGIPSPFRLMVHLRKKHFACDICLEDCREQGRLSSHVWKHKLHHLCYRCGIAYRNKMDITKHLFWKHGTESIICKRCLQKRWRHVYHFCVPPPSFVCELCNVCFSKATYLKVHKRVHTGDFRYPCTEDNCEEKFISRKLLLKHSATHAAPEIKVEEKIENETDAPGSQQEEPKVEEPLKEEKPLLDGSDKKEDVTKEEDTKKVDKSSEQVSKRKKKRNRNKESLEDLNLIAPNLSESDSSEESDVEKPKTEEKDSLVPNVLLSPPSEEEKDEEKDSPSKQVDKDTDKIMDIWENFKSFQASQQAKQEEEDTKSLSESNYPTPILHVACSDHDYCAMYKIRPRVPVDERKTDPAEETEQLDITSDTERDGLNDTLREKSISPTKKKRKSTGSGSSSSDSSSGSDSSCSCGSNCSCSTSGSSSNSSSSSDEDSDSSTSAGRRRIAEKKQERADRNRWKSESSLKASHSESADVVVEDKEPIAVLVVKESSEPVLIETDLETAESETDEEFYDEHPQKLASEMLAQKRLQLRAQMRLSPSHNFDIMENSRPSTPSLPEEMVKEKKVKLKKKKRDRKSTSKSQAVPPIKLNLSVNKVEISNNDASAVHQPSMQVPEVDLVPPYDLIASPGVAEPPVAQQPPTTPILQNSTIKPVPLSHTRMSEGSSCSDADNSLKRSKRARRPNKFYGYTSDDENTPGTPLLIGTRTFKPQPPPQLTWRKEDLPAPSKSILLNKQPRSPRTPKTPAGPSGQVKKRIHQKSSAKKKPHKLPPIPTLKIRPSKIGIPVVAPPLPPPLLPPPPPPVNNTYSSSREESDDSDSSDDDLELPAANTLPAASIVPQWATFPSPKFSAPPAPAPVQAEPPPPPPPQASAFNQKIPPALLPNPDFATIQYFKRNNIRYPIRPPAGARQARDGESVYCYCRCPYDEVSEMIACDGENCLIEWFHFECVGIMVAPQGKWFCAECRPKYSNELYPKL